MEADLADHLGRLLPCTVTLANDADLAALAETRHGAAHGLNDHITLLIDAGFGAGVVAEGTLIRGRWGRGGEMRWIDRSRRWGVQLGWDRSWRTGQLTEPIPLRHLVPTTRPPPTVIL